MALPQVRSTDAHPILLASVRFSQSSKVISEINEHSPSLVDVQNVHHLSSWQNLYFRKKLELTALALLALPKKLLAGQTV
eukprot:1154430-Pelagomonas_calceolata.AAC.2